MRYTRWMRIIPGLLLLGLLFGGAPAAAQEIQTGAAEGQQVAIYQGTCDQLGEVAFELGTLQAATDEGLDEVGAEDEVGAGLGDFSEFAGDDDVFDANDEGFLREDINADNTFEVGRDEDASGTFDENEVLGEDLNNDEALTEDEFTGTEDEAGTEDDVGAGLGDFSEFAGDDDVFDANDEGFLREDINADNTFEVGRDEDASGTLDENEVLGEDVNEDEALTEDEFGVGIGAEAEAEAGAEDETDVPGDIVACGNVAGPVDLGRIVVALEPLDESGSYGLAILEGEQVEGGTDVVVYVFENLQGPSELVDEAGAEDEVGAGLGDFSEFAGDDDVFDANDEGFLREDINADNTFEVGRDEDASGTLDENEVLGEDVNEDEALTEDEFGTETGVAAGAQVGGQEAGQGNVTVLQVSGTIETSLEDITAQPHAVVVGNAETGATGGAAGAGEATTDVFGDDGVFDANDEGFLREDINADETFEIGQDLDASGTLDENEVLGEDLNNDEALTEDELGDGTGFQTPESADGADALGEDGVLDANDQGFLREDIDADGIFEIGVDEDASGTLDENEVLGEDLNNDEALTEDELSDTSVTDTTDTTGTTGDAMGDDNIIDANDEGFLREDTDNDGIFEIGIDEDASGTLDENEVLGEDLNEDEALTEDELAA